MGGYEVTRTEKFKIFLQDKQKKSYPKIMYEALVCGIQEKEIPVHYITRFLYRKDCLNYLDYIGNKKVKKLQTSEELHSKLSVNVLENKILFHYLFSNTMVKTPKLLGCNIGDTFIDEENKKCYTLDKEKIAFIIKTMINKSDSDSVFIKPIDGIGGENSYRIDKDNLGEIDCLNEVFDNLIKGNFMYQDAIQQHGEISRIYPNSVNTLRIDTYLKNGNTNIISAFLRLGQGGSYIDNGSSGGCFVGIDTDKGVLKGIGHQLLEHGGNIYTSHPDTNFKFEGFEIPYFKEAKEMCIMASSILKDKLVGWDVAITEDGPLIIEGNHNYHIAMSEIAYGGFRNHSIYEEILKEYI